MSDWEADLARQRRNFEDPPIQPAPAPPDRSQPESDPRLQMGDRGLITAILLVVAAGVAVIALGYLAVDVLVEVSDRAITPAQQFTAAFALATALGALVALVVNVRKQNLAEQLARREITAAFTERFRSAAQQLGGVSPAERLAGVFAMAALADEYPTRRQQCVDVLCGYLRLPFDPAMDHLADRPVSTTVVLDDGRTRTTVESPASRPFDQQVRETILTVIRDHTKRDAPVSWSALDFNLAGAHLSNVNFAKTAFSGRFRCDGATFSGERTSFQSATFSGEDASFVGATFLGEDTSFAYATFSGGQTSFIRATFSGEHTSFVGATFSGEHTAFAKATFFGKIAFNGAKFTGDRTWFFDAVFCGHEATFHGAEFSGRNVVFVGATFSGEHTTFANATFYARQNVLVTFGGATFSKGTTSFKGATFSGEGIIMFHGAAFSGETTSFDKATFSGETTSFNEATFSGETTSFNEATFSGETTSFNEATFSGETTFDRVVLGDDTRVLGLEDPRLVDGARITRDGEPFRGWPPVNGSAEESGG